MVGTLCLRDSCMDESVTGQAGAGLHTGEQTCGHANSVLIMVSSNLEEWVQYQVPVVFDTQEPEAGSSFDPVELGDSLNNSTRV